MSHRYTNRKGRAAASITAFAIALIVVSGPGFTQAQSARAASPAPSQTSDASDTGRHFSDTDDAESEKYWTPERTASATPIDGTPKIPSIQDEQIGASEATTSFKPVHWIGRLFFTRNGRDYGCTASSIKSDSKLVIATAAHCLYHEGDFSTNLRFVPAWDGDNKPLSTWGANDYQVPREWRYDEDRDHDAGFVQLKPRRSWTGFKRYLADEAGATATNFGLARAGLHYEVFGYNQFSRYTPEPLIKCTGVGSLSSRNKAFLSILNCGMVGGSSGGPVYHESRKGVGGTQVGVVSVIATAEGIVGTITSCTPWGDVEYSVFQEVDKWGR